VFVQICQTADLTVYWVLNKNNKEKKGVEDMASMKDSSFGKKLIKSDGADSKTTAPAGLSAVGTTSSTVSKPAAPHTNTAPTTAKTAAPTTAKKAANRSEIEKRAYEIWKRQGCKAGRDLENWVQAEKELGLK
jgi:hypothetical protein